MKYKKKKEVDDDDCGLYAACCASLTKSRAFGLPSPTTTVHTIVDLHHRLRRSFNPYSYLIWYGRMIGHCVWSCQIIQFLHSMLYSE